MGTETLINSVGCKKCRPSYLKELRKKAEKARERLCSDCQRKIATNPLRIFDCKVETCQDTSARFPQITDYLCPDCEEHFRQFQSYLKDYKIRYKIEPRLVRGIDYYTKTTFEIVSSKLGAQDAILGGGRYDDMMKEFGGPDLCGIGFAVGMERLISLIPFSGETEDFLFIVHLGADARRVGMRLARDLRRSGVECLMEYKEKSLKTQMSRANRLAATWVLIIGEEELEKGKYKLKNMATGAQQEVRPEEILKLLPKSV